MTLVGINQPRVRADVLRAYAAEALWSDAGSMDPERSKHELFRSVIYHELFERRATPQFGNAWDA